MCVFNFKCFVSDDLCKVHDETSVRLLNTVESFILRPNIGPISFNQ